jgi:hypothetical protein
MSCQWPGQNSSPKTKAITRTLARAAGHPVLPWPRGHMLVSFSFYGLKFSSGKNILARVE